MPGQNPSEIDGLRTRERLAVDLLARGKTCRETAIALGITERTLYKWRKKSVVQRAIYSQQQELIDSGGGEGITVVPQAVATLRDIMQNPQARDADRIAASRALLSGAHAFQERKLLERTIADLETQLYGITARIKDVDLIPGEDVLNDEHPLLASASDEDEDE